jgi:hypothetical protein
MPAEEVAKMLGFSSGSEEEEEAPRNTSAPKGGKSFNFDFE